MKRQQSAHVATSADTPANETRSRSAPLAEGGGEGEAARRRESLGEAHVWGSGDSAEKVGAAQQRESLREAHCRATAFVRSAASAASLAWRRPTLAAGPRIVRKEQSNGGVWLTSYRRPVFGRRCRFS